MATFTQFSDLLPDPDNKIDTAGVSNASGNAGPGFAKVKFTSNTEVNRNRTISGRGTAASPYTHFWSFNISYNPMTRTQFEPVSTFLDMRFGGMKPFYIILPQHKVAQDSTFASYVNGLGGSVGISSAASAGESTLMLDVTAASGNPSPGDFFNIYDETDVNHTKTYRVTRLETNAYYQFGTTGPTVDQRRIHFVPPLVRNVDATATAVFKNPRFRVWQTNPTTEYDLDYNNLYEFSLTVEEILP